MPPMSQEMLPGGYWFRPVLIDELIPPARPPRTQDTGEFAAIPEASSEAFRAAFPAALTA